jgi:serine/threonine protein kinase
VRKELQTYTKDYNIELENLSLLKLLRHPNIIELLGCYTYRDSHNLIFPMAPGGDLSKLLKNDRPEYFTDNSTFLLALSGLASAINKVHNFVVDEFQLELTGCHHDLKALNILVDKDRFILADFGLSRFKDTAQDSATEFKTRKGYALAPECQELGGAFEKHKVHRWSDIWSFGCIVLDVLTYMLRGSKGVSDFFTRRRFPVETTTYYYFHKGSAPHEGVVSWIQELEDISSPSEKRMIRLIRKMLEIDPTARPTAIKVDAEMMSIALTALCEPILEQYRNLMRLCEASEGSIHPYIEEQRFLSWMMSLGLDKNAANGLKIPATNILDFRTSQAITQVLQTLRQELGVILNNGTINEALRTFLPLRRLNTSLMNILPPGAKAKARSLAEILILKTNSIQQLYGIQKLSKVQDGDRQVSVLAESKILRLAAEESAKSTGLQSWDLRRPITGLRDLGYHAIGLVKDATTGKEDEILIDYKHYEDPSIREKLFSRMNDIVELSQSLRSSDSIKVLYCRGYFHDESIESFGLVYDFPSKSLPRMGAERDKVTTLHKILFYGRRSQMPLLIDRFKLAKTLASYISELHKIGWVHKGISSSNIAFFYESEATLISALRKPYIIGFRHSRPQASFTEGPISDDGERDYEHPDYSQTSERYSLKYDYYSFGLVLLEIGLWRALKKDEELVGLSLAEARQHFTTVKVPRLGQSMGAAYRDVVYTYLGHGFDEYDGIEDETLRKSVAQLKFETEVLFKLSVLSQYEI